MFKLCSKKKNSPWGWQGADGGPYIGVKRGYNRYPIFTFTKLLKHFGPVDLSYEVQLYVQAIIWNKLIHPDHLEQYTHPNDQLSKWVFQNHKATSLSPVVKIEMSKAIQRPNVNF